MLAKGRIRRARTADQLRPVTLPAMLAGRRGQP
jgi:hypothetical protein